jgi:hypothetical protein
MRFQNKREEVGEERGKGVCASVPEKEAVGEEDTDQWGPVVNMGGKKRKRKRKKERGKCAGLSGLTRWAVFPGRPRWGAAFFLFFSFFLILLIPVLFV